MRSDFGLSLVTVFMVLHLRNPKRGQRRRWSYSVDRVADLSIRRAHKFETRYSSLQCDSDINVFREYTLLLDALYHVDY